MLALAGGVVLLVSATVWVTRTSTNRSSPHGDGEDEERASSALDSAATYVREATYVPSGEEELRPLTREESEESSGPCLRLRVLDAYDFRPLEGARVALFDRAEPTTRRTDEQGRCELDVADPPAENLLLVESAGHLAFRRKAPWEGSETLTLERAATLRARIVAADTGAAVPRAWAEFTPVDCDDCPVQRVIADEQGRVEVAPLAFERVLELNIGAEGFATRRLAYSLAPEEAHEMHEHEIHLPRGVRMFGRITDFTSGQPLAGARVVPASVALVTDANGRFDGHLQPLRGGAEFAFDIQADDHISLTVRGSVAELTSELELSLPGLAWIGGEVRDEFGEPVAGARVLYQPAEAERDKQGNLVESTPLYELPAGWQPWIDHPSTTTAEDGSYRLAVLPWALRGSLSATAREHESQIVPWTRTGPPGSVQDATFRLARSTEPPTLHGQLLLNGEAVCLAGELRWRGPTRSGSVIHDPIGGFKAVVEPGTIEVDAEFVAFPGRVSLPMSVRLGPHSARVLNPDVRIEEHRISGSVRDTSGAAFPGAKVWASCPCPGATPPDDFCFSRFTRSAADGSYQLNVIDFGLPFRIQCFVSGAGEEREGVTAGASGVDFVLPRGRSLFVRVRDERTGEVLAPGRDFELLLRASSARYESAPRLSDEPDPSGFHEYVLPEDRVDLIVLPDATLGPELAPEIRSGLSRSGDEPLRVELVLRRGITLELVNQGEPLPARAELYLVEDSLWDSVHRANFRDSSDAFQSRRRVTFDAHGRARLGLAAGFLRFKLYPEDLVISPESFHLDPGQPPVEVRWSPR
jgi:hypothetical protein